MVNGGAPLMTPRALRAVRTPPAPTPLGRVACLPVRARCAALPMGPHSAVAPITLRSDAVQLKACSQSGPDWL